MALIAAQLLHGNRGKYIETHGRPPFKTRLNPKLHPKPEALNPKPLFDPSAQLLVQRANLSPIARGVPAPAFDSDDFENWVPIVGAPSVLGPGKCLCENEEGRVAIKLCL